MSKERPHDAGAPEVLGSLPSTRPHRRSQKRPAPAASSPRETTQPARAEDGGSPRAAGSAPGAGSSRTVRGERRRPSERLSQPPQPVGPPRTSRTSRTPKPRADRPPVEPADAGARAEATPLIATAVQAAAELAEIGLAVGARALRIAASRFPRP